MKLKRENKVWIVSCGSMVYATRDLKNAINFIQFKKTTVLFR